MPKMENFAINGSKRFKFFPSAPKTANKSAEQSGGALYKNKNKIA